MALCSACCGDEGQGELAPVETHRAGIGFSAPLDQALGGPGTMREEQAVVDASKRREEAEVQEAREEEPRGVRVSIFALPPPTAHNHRSASVKIRESVVFDVEIPKGDRKLGLDLNFHDQRTLMVTKVNAGPIQDFNRAHPASELAPGDRIEAVNGEESDTQRMLDACRAASSLKLRVRRCEERTITLSKGADALGLGLSWKAADGMTLCVTKVDEEGLASEHNRAHPNHDIDHEDRIIGVNGVRSDVSKLQEALRDPDTFMWDLVLRRIWPGPEEL